MRTFKFILLSSILSSCLNSNDTKQLAIQPLDDCPEYYIDSISAAIEANYGFTVLQLDAVSIPEAFYVTVKTPRYRADSILYYLNRIKPESCDFILGVTVHDISCTKRDENGNVLKPEERYADWGVFGLGQRPGTASVISSYRLSKERSVEQLTKVGMHELGHNFGLPHCTKDDHCVMRDAAEKLSTVDNVNKTLCAQCKTLVNR